VLLAVASFTNYEKQFIEIKLRKIWFCSNELNFLTFRSFVVNWMTNSQYQKSLAWFNNGCCHLLF